MISIINMITSISAILRKELRSYFTSPIAYVVAAVFWILAGFFFTSIVSQALLISLQVDQFAQQGGGQSFDAPMAVSQQFLSVLGTLSLFILPMLTMGLYAEERRRGTMELLATSPITNLSVALGKWLAVLTFYLTMLLPLFAYGIVTYSSSNPPMDYRMVWVGFVGLLLLSASVMALGMFVSSLTDNTLIAAVGTFGMVLLLYVIDAAAGDDSGVVSSTLRHLSLLEQYAGWVRGAISTSSIIMFVSMIALGIFLTVQSIELLRWQRN